MNTDFCIQALPHPYLASIRVPSCTVVVLQDFEGWLRLDCIGFLTRSFASGNLKLARFLIEDCGATLRRDRFGLLPIHDAVPG